MPDRAEKPTAQIMLGSSDFICCAASIGNCGKATELGKTVNIFFAFFCDMQAPGTLEGAICAGNFIHPRPSRPVASEIVHWTISEDES